MPLLRPILPLLYAAPPNHLLNQCKKTLVKNLGQKPWSKTLVENPFTSQ